MANTNTGKLTELEEGGFLRQSHDGRHSVSGISPNQINYRTSRAHGPAIHGGNAASSREYDGPTAVSWF